MAMSDPTAPKPAAKEGSRLASRIEPRAAAPRPLAGAHTIPTRSPKAPLPPRVSIPDAIEVGALSPAIDAPANDARISRPSHEPVLGEFQKALTQLHARDSVPPPSSSGSREIGGAESKSTSEPKNASTVPPSSGPETRRGPPDSLRPRSPSVPSV